MSTLQIILSILDLDEGSYHLSSLQKWVSKWDESREVLELRNFWDDWSVKFKSNEISTCVNFFLKKIVSKIPADQALEMMINELLEDLLHELRPKPINDETVFRKRLVKVIHTWVNQLWPWVIEITWVILGRYLYNWAHFLNAFKRSMILDHTAHRGRFVSILLMLGSREVDWNCRRERH